MKTTHIVYVASKAVDARARIFVTVKEILLPCMHLHKLIHMMMTPLHDSAGSTDFMVL